MPFGAARAGIIGAAGSAVSTRWALDSNDSGDQGLWIKTFQDGSGYLLALEDSSGKFAKITSGGGLIWSGSPLANGGGMTWIAPPHLGSDNNIYAHDNSPTSISSWSGATGAHRWTRNVTLGANARCRCNFYDGTDLWSFWENNLLSPTSTGYQLYRINAATGVIISEYAYESSGDDFDAAGLFNASGGALGLFYTNSGGNLFQVRINKTNGTISGSAGWDLTQSMNDISVEEAPNGDIWVYAQAGGGVNYIFRFNDGGGLLGQWQLNGIEPNQASWIPNINFKPDSKLILAVNPDTNIPPGGYIVFDYLDADLIVERWGNDNSETTSLGFGAVFVENVDGVDEYIYGGGSTQPISRGPSTVPRQLYESGRGQSVPDGNVTAQSIGTPASATPDFTLGSNSATNAAGTGSFTQDGLVLTKFQPIAGIPDAGIGEFNEVDPGLNGNDQINGIDSNSSTVVAVGEVAGGGNGAALRSLDAGLTWTDETSNLAETDALEAVVWDGTVFVAVGTGNFVQTSPDGSTWTRRNAAGFNQRKYSACLLSNGKLFVGAQQGECLYNTTAGDYTAWTDADPTADLPSAIMFGCASSGTALVGVFADGSIWSADSETAPSAWTQRNTSAGSVRAVTWSDDLSLFIAVGDADFWTSPDGITWTSRGEPTNQQQWRGVFAGNNGVFAISNANPTPARAYFSANGINWFRSPINGPPASVTLNCVHYIDSDNVWIVGGDLDGGTSDALIIRNTQ